MDNFERYQIPLAIEEYNKEYNTSIKFIIKDCVSKICSKYLVMSTDEIVKLFIEEWDKIDKKILVDDQIINAEGKIEDYEDEITEHMESLREAQIRVREAQIRVQSYEGNLQQIKKFTGVYKHNIETLTSYKETLV